MINIDKKKYKIGEDNYIKKKTKKNLIIIGDTCRSSSNHIIRMQQKDFGNSREWNTFTISRDGKIYQHYNPDYYSDYSGDVKIDKRSISILFENMNCLNAVDEKYYNWINEECKDIHNIYKKYWKSGYYWEKYTEEQYNSLAGLLIELFDKYKDIPNRIIASNLYESESYNYKGVLSRSNISKEEVDVNPSFDYKKLISLISNKIEIVVD